MKLWHEVAAIGSPLGRARSRTLAVAAAGIAVWLGAGLGARRLRSVEEAAEIIAGERSEGEALASALGGFRGLASDFLWLRAIQMQEEGRFDEINLLCKLILDMQPRFSGVWTFLSWNLAYNLAFESNTPAERWHWIREGSRLLEEAGIHRNRNSWEIPFEIGFMYYSRVSRKGYDPFYRYYQERISPVPDWCAEPFEFVDKGLWSDRRVRYRLYRRSFPAGQVTLGAASAAAGFPTRARRMYVVLVKPAGALVRAELTSRGGGAELGSAELAPGAPLYIGAPDRVAAGKFPGTHAWEAPEPAVPSELEGAALVPLPEKDRVLKSDAYVSLELGRPAEVWVGWVADETRNFHIARKWFFEAERKAGGRWLMVARVRVHALEATGDREGAYEEWLELMRVRPQEDRSVPAAFRNFLTNMADTSRAAGDRRSAEKWRARLRANFPSATMPPADAGR